MFDKRRLPFFAFALTLPPSPGRNSLLGSIISTIHHIRISAGDYEFATVFDSLAFESGYLFFS